MAVHKVRVGGHAFSIGTCGTCAFFHQVWLGNDGPDFELNARPSANAASSSS